MKIIVNRENRRYKKNAELHGKLLVVDEDVKTNDAVT